MTGTNDGDGRDERDERRDDDLAAYALDAVDDEERATIERALAESAHLRDEAEAFRRTAVQLADLATPATPPADLRARLMASLDSTPQAAATPARVPDAAAQPSRRESAAPASAPAPAPAPAPGRAEAEARRRWFRRPGVLVAAAAAAVVLIVGAVVGIGWPGPNGWGSQLERAAIAAAPDAETTVAEVDGAEVTLVASAERGQSVLTASGLPDVGADETFQLWYIDDAGATSAGTFDASAGETWRVLDGTFTPGVAVGVTVEPAGGSAQPTTEPIVVIAT